MDARLSAAFDGVVSKRLSAVECYAYGTGNSNQGEIAAGRTAPSMLGTPVEPVRYGCRYIYLSDAGIIDEPGQWVTYGDPRRNDPTRGPEWRLTYPRRSEVMNSARSGDLIWVARRRGVSDALLVIVAASQSDYANRLDRILSSDMRLEEADDIGRRPFDDVELDSFAGTGLDSDDADLLTLLGVDVEVPSGHLDLLLEHLVGARKIDGWPTTQAFSAACRRIAGIESPLEDVDLTIVTWFDLTNELFYVYERHVIQPELDEAFANAPSIDIDRFFAMANRHRGRRASRAGNTFEWHLAALFSQLELCGDMKKRLPDGTAPDFIFPSFELYLDETFQDDLLTVLGAKTTLKERWQQVVNEGKRHAVTYLATMDKDLSLATLNTMTSSRVVPVLPRQYIEAHYGSMASRFCTVSEFVQIVRERELAAEDWGIDVSQLPRFST